MRNSPSLIKILALGSLALLVAGCAGLKPATPEEAVAERAQAYFDAVIAKDFKTSYALHAPSYRDRYNYDAHVLRSTSSGINYVAAKVLRVNCPSAEACVAMVELSYKAVGLRSPLKSPVTTMLEDRWVYIDGEWGRIPAQ